MRSLLLTSTASVLLSLSCSGKTEPAPGTPRPDSPSPPAKAGSHAEDIAPPAPAVAVSPGPVTVRMHEHLMLIEAVKHATIAGDVGKIKETAEPLADAAEQTTLPDVWQPHVRAVNLQAKAVMDAPDLAGAARGAALMAERCGACHDASSARVVFDSMGAAPAGSGAAPHMLRHQWALDRLWEGLVGPDDARWIAGAEALSDAPLAPTDATDKGAGAIAEIARLADATHALGLEAREAKGEARAPIYGELLTTCQACHTLATKAPAGTTAPDATP